MPKSFGGVDLAHTKSGHMYGGSRVTGSKDLWPAGTKDEQIISIAEQAFRNNPTITGYDSHTNMIRARSTVNGQLYEMMVNDVISTRFR
jgi:competence protein ComGF